MRSSPFIQLSLDFDGHFPDSFTLPADSFTLPADSLITSPSGGSGGLSSEAIRFIYIGSGHFGTTRHYISSDGFPWTLDLRTLVLRKSYARAYIAPALRARGSKVRAYLRMRHKFKSCYVHRIVAQYFLNGGQPIPPGMQVDHLDSNIYNNAVSNLEIVTAEENNRRRNLKHGYKHMSAHARAAAARHNRKRCARIHATLTAPERPPVEAGGAASA